MTTLPVEKRKAAASAARWVLTRKLRVLLKYKYRYLLILPGLLYILIFKYGPLYGVTIAFLDYSPFKGIGGSSWVGLKWFRVFMESPDFWQVTRNTIVISVMKIVFGMTPDILLALLLNEVRKSWFKRIIQTLTYMPHFLSWVIIYGIVIAFLSPTTGLVNHMLQEWGMSPVAFLMSNDWFRWILIGSDIWKDIGWGAIIYLAALTAIDQQLYEAATIDGAGRWKQTWHITLPGIRNVIVLLLILKLGTVLDAGFTQIYAMYNPLVYESVDIIDTWVYRKGIIENNFSMATAVGLFKSVIGLLLVLGANKLAKKFGDSGIW
ncbi:ABC transporter permease subunit [Paenibacillus sp. J5C_2022]|uniref:ABC transporter permease n=1 Tax=Paenibacillus sp. J5C2022 TaxID=2977129 RepID=UPI0021CF1B21|nr:ABC transporter permease subunit [Paenibacillus sp. J5C2022]MCU6709156.1 ABC transporter permease subunit [Paenibacillus sp. J5C2022]